MRPGDADQQRVASRVAGALQHDEIVDGRRAYPWDTCTPVGDSDACRMGMWLP